MFAVGRILLVVVAALSAGACAHHSHKVGWPDAPLELRDDTDRDQAIDHLWVTPPGPELDAARTRIATAIAHRIADALEEDRPIVAANLFDQLVSLWQDDPMALGKGLAGHAALVEKLRSVFARSGAVEPALLSLVTLMEIGRASCRERVLRLV